jgi:large subunit ribosomal protein L29
MQIAELRGKTQDELKTLLGNLKKEALNLRFQRVSGELSNTSRVRVVRRTIARIHTLLVNETGGNVAQKPAKAAKPKKEKETKDEGKAKKESAKKAAPKKAAAPKKKAKTA